MLTVAVLGPVEVRRDGVRLQVPTGKTSELLVRLALDAGERVRGERLVEDLWSDDAPGVARNTLQAKVSKLRRALGDPRLVSGNGAGYALAVAPSAVDALEVLRLAGSVTAPRTTADAEAAAATCAAALGMFRGELLPDGGDGAWLAARRARLEEARWGLAEQHVAARLRLGAGAELVGELEDLVAVQPLRETGWALLITALYQAGRQADALSAYQRLRRRLDEDLGIEPGPALQLLEEQVLRQDPALDLAAAGGSSAAPAPRHGNLAAPATPLVGRAGHVDAVASLLADHRLVTVTGPAGVGKTRLAVEVARRVEPAGGGAWLVRLEAAGSAAAVWQGVGEVLGRSGADEANVIDRLRGHDLLLVLDGCEHLVEPLPDVVARLLGAAPGVRILATSQAALAAEGEVVLALEPLSLPDSVELFAQRAARARPTFVLDADSGPAAETVCRSLDGLPLAIELAAARTKVLSVQEIARRLDDRFTLLSDPVGAGPPRRSALRAAIAWSYDLLFPDDQRGLWALSCFPAGAPLAASEAVLTALGVPLTSTVDVITRLADRSLVTLDVEPGGAVRHRLLDSVREFGVERLRASGAADVARGAQAAWFAEAADRAAGGIRGPDQATHLSLLRSERANIDAALAWTRTHDPATALRIASGFGWGWGVLGAGPDAARSMRTVLDSAAGVAAIRDVATGRLLAGWLEASGGDLDQAVADLGEGMRIGDAGQHSVGRLYLSFVRSQQGRAGDALALLAACRADFHRSGRTWEEGASWLLTAWAEIALGDTARGKAACDEALRLLRPLGDQWALGHLEGMLGGLAQAEHRFSAAAAHLARAADAAHRLGFAAAESHHLANLGRVQEQSGDSRAAVATYERAVEAARATGDLRTSALASARLGRLLRAVGDRAAARMVAEPARDWYAEAGGGDAALLADYVVAALDADDHAADAEPRLARVVAAARGGGDAEVEVLALDTLAVVLVAQGRTDDARATLAEADRAAAAAHHLVTDADRADRDRVVALLPEEALGRHRS